MNKEVNYVVQGFLLTLFVIGAFKFSGYLMSIPPPPDEPSLELSSGTVSLPGPPLSATAVKGKIIFQNNCATCHVLHKDMTGPALAGVHQRITDKKLLYKWIRNPSAVLQSGDKYFTALQKRFGGLVMSGFNDLSDDEIGAVLTYIEENSK